MRRQNPPRRARAAPACVLNRLRDARVPRLGHHGSSWNSLLGPELMGHCHRRCRGDNALSAVRADHPSAQSLPHGRLLPSLYRAREARDSAHAFRHVGLRNRVRAVVAPRRRTCQLILGAPFRPLGRKRALGSVSARFRAGLPGARPACIAAGRRSTGCPPRLARRDRAWRG